MTNLQYNDEQQQITEQSKEQLSLLCEKKLPRVRYAELKSTENIRENITTVDNHKCRVSQRNLQSYRSQNAKWLDAMASCYYRRWGLAIRLVGARRRWPQWRGSLHFDVEDRRRVERRRVHVRRLSVGVSAAAARPDLLLLVQPCRRLLHRTDDVIRRCPVDDCRIRRSRPPAAAAAETQRQSWRCSSPVVALHRSVCQGRNQTFSEWGVV